VISPLSPSLEKSQKSDLLIIKDLCLNATFRTPLKHYANVANKVDFSNTLFFESAFAFHHSKIVK